jgi:beta-glucanase (GH16 family)
MIIVNDRTSLARLFIAACLLAPFSSSAQESAVGSSPPVISAGGHASPDSYPGMKLVWRDEFGGSRLDKANWTHETGTGAVSRGADQGELQYFRPENTTVRDGYLVITAHAEPGNGGVYHSSGIETLGKQQFRYGRIDVRALMPRGRGLRPALRMVGADISESGWPACGEIDIMEMVGGDGRENTVHGTAHWQQPDGYRYLGGGYILPSWSFDDQFHVFSIIWDESRIQWLVDGQSYHELDITAPGLDAFRAPFFFIINLAVGGDWAGAPDSSTEFPQTLAVDYIRVFQNHADHTP